MSDVLISLLAIGAFIVALAATAVCFRLSQKLTRFARKRRQEHQMVIVRQRALEQRIEDLTAIVAVTHARSSTHQQRETGANDAARCTAVSVIAKAAGIAILSLFSASSKMALDGERDHHAAVRTAKGETSEIRLPDHSIVAVNTDSSVFVDLTEQERAVALSRGEARFDVAKDGRPFIVRTPHAIIRALGTSFNIQLSRDCTFVTVLHGRVEVIGRRSGSVFGSKETGSHRVELYEGDRAAVTADAAILPDSGPPVHRVRGWGEGRLVFRNETLADVVSEVNRYHERPIRIADPHLAGYRITGSFNMNDRQFLVDYLRVELSVSADTEADGTIVLGR